MEDDLNFCLMEDDLIFFENGRRPHFFGKWMKTSILFTMEGDLNFLENGWKPQFFVQWVGSADDWYPGEQTYTHFGTKF